MGFKRFLSAALAFVMLTAILNSTPNISAVAEEAASNTSSTTSSNTSSTEKTEENKEKLYTGVVDIESGTLSIRSEPDSTSTLLGSLRKNDKVTIHGEKMDGKDKRKWYKIEYGNAFAYVCADYISNVTEKEPPAEYVPDATFEENLTNQKFPESYKVLLRELYANHPNWIFMADHLELTWDEALAAESKVGKSLVSKSRPDSYKSMEYGAYDWKNNTYIGFDGTSWVSAHKDIVAYFMEPRNFINENGIYQFLDQSFNEKHQNIEGINKIIKNTFMDKAFPETTHTSYADLILAAGKQSKVNPYVLAAMIIQEQGRKGESGLISGTYGGALNGFYNHFNIGAYATSTLSAVQRGLYYASGHPDYVSEKNKIKYGLPWNTIAKSIIGGSIWYGSGYIEVGQDTLYYKKFDFIGPNYYNHQYMTNIEGANSEAIIMKNAYAEMPEDAALTFSIPVFKNMPEENKTSLPEKSGANNYYLSQITVEGHQLTPSFDLYKRSYELVVDYAFSKVNVSATAVSTGATVSGTGSHSLKVGDNTIKLTVTAASGRTS
ncbi:MAG: SH3 domain-containing protein, partial [Clostridia bacterium]|nr:SH3 domain-containing protein [Clostridia bacterium]